MHTTTRRGLRATALLAAATTILMTGSYSAIRGKELIGKHYKLFTEKHEHGGIGGGPVQFEITEREAEL